MTTTRGRAEAEGRLAFLDGLRGLAALYVVGYHALVEAEATGRSTSGWGAVASAFFRHGHYAVGLFLVVSGYSLTRPLAGDPAGRVRGGLLGYLGRRAGRIIPPYYAALGLGWASIALVPGLARPAGVPWDVALPAGGVGVVASHLLLIQNLRPGWINRVDPPAWTLATEWQIYLIFPALLVVRRRLGMAATVAVGFGLGWAVAGVGAVVGNPALVKLCPWYLGLFTLGMAAATAAGGRTRRDGAGWWLVAGVVALVPPFLMRLPGRDVMVADPIVGLAAAGLVARLGRRAARGETSALLRALSGRRLGWLGSISYSLYLTHFPILALAGATVRGLGIGLGPVGRLGAMLGLAVPGAVLVAWPFARAFERRWFERARLRPEVAEPAEDADRRPGRLGPEPIGERLDAAA